MIYKVFSSWGHKKCEYIWEDKYQDTHSVLSAQLTMKICQW